MLPIRHADRQHLKLLLSPSWLSGLIAVLAGLVIAVGAVIVFSLNASGIQQQLLSWQQTQPPKIQHGQIMTESDKPTVKGSWPLIIVWSLIGFAVYGVAAAIIHSIGEAADLKKSLNYVNAQPHSILEVTAEHFALRAVGFITLSGLLYLFIEQIIPYTITAAHASASDLTSLNGLLYLLLSFAVITLTVHTLAIFLRLSLGRPRVFS